MTDVLDKENVLAVSKDLLHASLAKLEEVVESYAKKVAALSDDKKLLLQKFYKLQREQQDLERKHTNLQQAYDELTKSNQSVLGDLSESIDNLEKLLAPSK